VGWGTIACPSLTSPLRGYYCQLSSASMWGNLRAKVEYFEGSTAQYFQGLGVSKHIKAVLWMLSR